MKRYLLLAVILAALFGLGLTPGVRIADLKSADLLAGRHFADPDIAILAVDNKSIAAIGRWPWPRNVEANTLDALAKYSPRAVAIDINFSESEDAANDAALAGAIGRAKFPIVLPIETVRLTDGSSRYVYPLAIFTAARNVSWGSVDVPLSADGAARFLPDAGGTSGQNGAAPFAFATAKLAGGVLPQPQTGRAYAINFAGPAGTFATYSIIDLLQNKLPPGDLNGKIIIIGATAGDLHDVVPVPAEPGGVMAGAEWHANIVDNILLQRLFAVPPPVALDLAGIILAAILFALFSRMRVSAALIAALAALIAIPLASYFALRANILIPYFFNEALVGAAFAVYGFERWYAAEIEKRKIKRTMQNYFSPAVLDVILKNPKALSLGGERKEVTILFSDIRSFTTIAEKTPPEILAKLLHEYFTEMTEEILATDGVLDKFIGDAIMAFWGAPLEQPDHANRAVRAAMGMMRRLGGLQKKWAADGLPFVDIGVGVHTGHAIVGNMGSEKRFDYTVIGDAVNAASRLEGLNKTYQTHIIISDATRKKLAREVAAGARALGEVTVKGKTAALAIYRIDALDVPDLDR